MNFLKKHWWKILIVFLVAFALMAWLKPKSGEKIDLNNPPQFIQADFIDLSRIGQISKFRSGSGHDFSGGGETCRSMKHYFNAIRTEAEQKYINQNNGYPPTFTLKDAIAIYSPVDGKIISVEGENSEIGKQIYIRPDYQPSFTVRLFHIYLLDNFGRGSKVKAGEQIGHIGKTQNTDIAVGVNNIRGQKFVSYFQVMPDSVFAKYQKLGIKNRGELIISKEERNANPLQCNGEKFAKNYDNAGGGLNIENFVYINGYGAEQKIVP